MLYGISYLYIIENNIYDRIDIIENFSIIGKFYKELIMENN